jgi:hypothetical protein
MLRIEAFKNHEGKPAMENYPEGVSQMDQKEIVKQMIQYNKTAFENTFNNLVMLQDQMEKTMDMFLKQAAWLPAEGKKVIEEWVKANKKGRENFKNVVDQSFKKVGGFFGGTAAGPMEGTKEMGYWEFKEGICDSAGWQLRKTDPQTYVVINSKHEKMGIFKSREGFFPDPEAVKAAQALRESA